jgi:hypothetical protein
MFKFVRRLAQGPPKSKERLREEVLERYDEIGRSVAKRFVRGNVNIKAGRFMTKPDLAKRKRDTASRHKDQGPR